MARRKKESLSKENVEGFRGGINVDLKRKLKTGDNAGKTLRDALSSHLKEVLDLEIQNQSSRMRKLDEWDKQYRGVDEPRIKEWQCGLVTPYTRKNTDALYVRGAEAIEEQSRIYTIRAIDKDFVDIDRNIEDGLDDFLRNQLHYMENISSPLKQCFKAGTGICMVKPVIKRRVIYRYATAEEKNDKSVKKYPSSLVEGSKSDPVVKEVITTYDGPALFPIDRANWVMTSDSHDVQSAYMCGFMNEYRKAQLETKVRQGLFYEDEVAKLSSPDGVTEHTKEKAENESKEVKKTESGDPYQIWELWLRYDVDEDGEEDSIVVTFHRDSGAVLRCIYNPWFIGLRPFQPIRFYLPEFSFDGEGVPEILEGLQHTIDTMERQRIDRMHEINLPITVVQEDCGIKDFDLEPGKTHYVDRDAREVIDIIQFPNVYPSSIQEQMNLMQMGEHAIGNTPIAQGISTAERPVARESMLLQQETNKKFKDGIRQLRRDLANLGYLFLECFGQYTPTYEYKVGEQGQNGEMEFKDYSMTIPTTYIRDGLKVELSASNELLNQETRRQQDLVIYQMLQDYYTNVASMVQAAGNPQTPPELLMFVMAIAGKGDKLITKILRDFDQKDSDEFKADAGQYIQQALQRMAQQPPPQQRPQGMPPGMPHGGPPQGMPMGPPPRGMM